MATGESPETCNIQEYSHKYLTFSKQIAIRNLIIFPKGANKIIDKYLVLQALTLYFYPYLDLIKESYRFKFVYSEMEKLLKAQKFDRILIELNSIYLG